MQPLFLYGFPFSTKFLFPGITQRLWHDVLYRQDAFFNILHHIVLLFATSILQPFENVHLILGLHRIDFLSSEAVDKLFILGECTRQFLAFKDINQYCRIVVRFFFILQNSIMKCSKYFVQCIGWQGRTSGDGR